MTDFVFVCEHGERRGPLMLCSAPAAETGALEAWRAKACGRLIVTPGWCEQKCCKHKPAAKHPATAVTTPVAG